MFRYRFTIILQDKLLKDTCDLMRKLDLDIGEVGNQHTFQFNTKEDIPIATIKEKLINAITTEGTKVLHIEGGKIE